MLTNLSINYVLSIKARILAKNPCIENTGIFGCIRPSHVPER